MSRGVASSVEAPSAALEPDGGVEGDALVFDGFGVKARSSIASSFDAGGPTGTILEPNSTPIVTSWDGEKRPSQRRIVNYAVLAWYIQVDRRSEDGMEEKGEDSRLIYRYRSHRCILA